MDIWILDCVLQLELFERFDILYEPFHGWFLLAGCTFKILWLVFVILYCARNKHMLSISFEESSSKEEVYNNANISLLPCI